MEAYVAGDAVAPPPSSREGAASRRAEASGRAADPHSGSDRTKISRTCVAIGARGRSWPSAR